jgi:hypothetical protein
VARALRRKPRAEIAARACVGPEGRTERSISTNKRRLDDILACEGTIGPSGLFQRHSPRRTAGLLADLGSDGAPQGHRRNGQQEVSCGHRPK